MYLTIFLSLCTYTDPTTTEIIITYMSCNFIQEEEYALRFIIYLETSTKANTTLITKIKSEKQNKQSMQSLS